MSHDRNLKNSPIRSAPDGVDLLGQTGEQSAEFNPENEGQRTYQTANELRAYLENRGGGRDKAVRPS
jgi:hypothetical protein